jgi:putative membrane-bound dehydrogenase-like protein
VARVEAVPASAPGPVGRRLEVLFLGSEDKFGHDPLARFRVIRRALGPAGVNFTYSATLDALEPSNLALYDVLLVFANHETISVPQQEALLGFARGGGGCVLLHCAAGCFRGSRFDAYVELLGAQFDSHGTGVFRAEVTAPDHPAMRGFEGFECWDETYVHRRHSPDRTVLMHRGEEPWTWVKTYGEGRVFYTASGHDHRCWDLPGYQDLVRRAVFWTAGDERASLPTALRLPTLEYRRAAVPENPENPAGPMNRIQLPLPPSESVKLAQVPPGFRLEVFAAEPLVVNPIAINWDDRGRLWVVEAFDYPHKAASDTPQDRIKILEDTDADGAADRATVFAEGLNIATTVLPVPGGALATDADRIVFLRDLDGDDRADRKDVLFTGLGLRDTHACTSNFHYGPDNWVYGTVGYSGLQVESGGRVHESEMGVFRFRPDGSAFEVLQATSNNTWGLAFTEEGDVVGSTANGNPSWYLSIPRRYFEAAGLDPEPAPRADSQDLAYPVTGDYFQNWPKEQFSSASGHEVYSGTRFPAGWSNRRALVCEPPLHLVAAPLVREEGDGFKTSGFEHNLYASADAWSAPVAAAPGPDGAVWIADWYSPVCNHNPYRPHHERGPGNALVTDDRDRSHGRVYRVFPAGTEETVTPPLDNLEERVNALAHPSQFWRLAAQKALVLGGGHRENPGPLYALAEAGRDPGSLHAIWVLDGWGWRGEERFQVLCATLATSADRGVAAAAVGMLEPSPSTTRLLLDLAADAERHPIVRQAAFLALTEQPPDPETGASLARLALAEPPPSGHLATALTLAATRHPEGFLRQLIESGTAPDDAKVAGTFDHLALRFGAGHLALSPGLLAFAAASGAPAGQRLVAVARQPAAGPEPAVQLSESARRGRAAYLACVACHQPDGRGLPPSFPPLVGSPVLAGSTDSLVGVVLKGLAGEIVRGETRYDGVMPGHEASLGDAEIADILNYLRSSWGNAPGGVVTAEDVAATRSALRERREPFRPDELNSF